MTFTQKPSTGALFTPHVSDTARAKVAADLAYLPADAAETAGGWLTLTEELDARYSPIPDAMGDMDFETATAIAERLRPLTAHEIERKFRDWRAERAPLVRQLAWLLSLYPRPMFITANRPPRGDPEEVA